jgi:hypothetical protein
MQGPRSNAKICLLLCGDFLARESVVSEEVALTVQQARLNIPSLTPYNLECNSQCLVLFIVLLET